MKNDTPKEEILLREKLSKANHHFSILYDISNAMRTTLELNHILYIILTGVTAHTGLGFNRAGLFLVNKKDRILEGRMGIGPESGEQADQIWRFIETSRQNLDDLISAYKKSHTAVKSPFHESITKIKIPLNKEQGGLLAKVYFDEIPSVIRENEISRHKKDPLLNLFKTNELIITPLKAKDKINGLIVADNLYTQKSITDDDLKIFIMLGNQAGLAIENSQLFEMIVHKSHTDSLTNLWNHGFFQDTLLCEVEKSREHKTPLSLALLDMDDFKKLNDNLGHQHGDLILAKVANIFKESSRENDYVCRYGGEEFSIILPDTNKDQAYIIAERLREKIAKHLFTEVGSDNPIKLTVSIGIASFPQDASTKEDLISQADRLMYTAKFSGKNKTCLS